MAKVTSSITDAQRDRIRDMITDSYIAHPRQSPTFVRAESRRIAARVFGRENVESRLGSVAAVRANYSRKAYGAPATLRKNRLAAMKKAVNS